MKMRITLSQEASNRCVINNDLVLPILSNKEYTVTYNMTEGCSTTDKFISLYKDNISVNEKFRCGFNIYKSNTVDMFAKLKHEMNNIITEINNNRDCLKNVDISLMLDPTSLDLESDKTNALHLYFENEANKLIELGGEYESGVYKLLEDINQIVHLIERGCFEDYSEFFCSMRIAEYPNMVDIPTLPLTDEDYENFNIHESWGSLTLDYFRVGKDLNHCYMTNDLELIKTKGLAQQNTIHTAVVMVFNDWRPLEELEDYQRSYRKWIEDNNFKQYYDTDLPMFTSGRIILGTVDMAGTSEEEVQNELAKCTGITNVELVDE